MNEPAPSSDTVDTGQSETTLRVRQDIIWREIDGEIVLLDLKGEAYFTLTASGSVLWPSLVAGSTAAALAQALSARFSLDPGQALADVNTFIESLSAQGMLEDGSFKQRGP